MTVPTPRAPGRAQLSPLALVPAGRTGVAATVRTSDRALRRAVDGGGRSVVFQPVVDVRTGVAVGAEALAAFEGGTGAETWFAEAEAHGLGVPLERAAAASAIALRDRAPGRFLTVNMSPAAVLAGALDAVLAGVDAQGLVLEVTEHAPVSDYEALAAALAPHRAAGLQLAVDDAGAGYASFRHVLLLRPEWVKLDRSLVSDVHLDPVRQALTASLLTFCRTSGAQLVAEGVEQQDELDCLARLGVAHMQGWLFGRPAAEIAPDGYARVSERVVVGGDRQLAAVLAEAVRHGRDLEEMVRPLLDAIIATTGLETSYVTLRDEAGLHHPYVRNAGAAELPEGFTLPWEQSLCSAMRERGLSWTRDAAADIGGPLVEAFAVRTFVTVAMTDDDGGVLGTVCAASTRPVYVSDAVLAQLELVARVLAAEVARGRRPPA